MIKSFIGKSGGGKSLCMLAEAVSQKDKKVAFISLEVDMPFLLKRLSQLPVNSNSLLLFNPPLEKTKTLSNWIFDKIKDLKSQVDIICIDNVDCVPLDGFSLHKFQVLNLFFKQINELLSDSSVELWISKGVNIKMDFSKNFVQEKKDYLTDLTCVSSFEVEDLIKVKQVCRKVENDLLKDVVLIEAIDLETKEVKTYNLTNLFKN